MRVPTKFDRCKTCDIQYEWTNRKSGFCKPCRAENKRDYNKRYKKEPRKFERETLPPVDGVMELQFRTFFSLMRVRYTCVKDINIVQHATYRK